MVKEILFEIVMNKLDLGDRRKNIISRYINSYPDEYLLHALQTPQGLIVDDLNIYFHPTSGFRCFNNPKYGFSKANCQLVMLAISPLADCVA